MQPPPDTATSDFAIHGASVRVESTERRLCRDLEERLAYFVSDDAGRTDLRVTYRVLEDAQRDPIVRPGGAHRVVYEPLTGEMLYFPGSNALYVELPRLRMHARPTDGAVDVSLRAGAEEEWLATRSVLMLGLNEFLKTRGLFPVHAAGVVDERGATLLLAGANGAGKSTLALALVARQLDFQGDDRLFLDLREGSLRVLPFPDRVGVTPETARLIPELATRAPLLEPLPPGIRKREIDVTSIWPVGVAGEAAPGCVVMIDRRDEKPLRLERLDASEALLRLVGNVLLTAPSSVQAHLDALGLLVDSCPCYSLAGSGDPSTAADLLLECLSGR